MTSMFLRLKGLNHVAFECFESMKKGTGSSLMIGMVPIVEGNPTGF